MPEFSSRDPSQPGFWDERFAAGFTPWESAGVAPALRRWLDTGGPAAGSRVLVPGCGSAVELGLLAARGVDVLALDYSPVAVERARRQLPALADRIRLADFFAFEAEPFDCIVERAFLAALPPRLWQSWADSCARLLRPGGMLAGAFSIDESAADPRRGPPFAVTPAEIRRLLGAAFEPAADDAVAASESAPVFAGRERWQVWRRR